MGTHITQAQLEEVKRMAYNGAEPVQVYRALAIYGDAYAQGAVAVFKPDSKGWYAVRSIWHETNADMSKFDDVARTHMNQYIGLIERGRDGQGYRLPNSAQIEESYVQALEKSGLTAKTAIDVNISKIKITEYSSEINNSIVKVIPNWYNTPAVMWLEKERIQPSYAYIMNKVDGHTALNIYSEVFGSVRQQLTQEGASRTNSHIPRVIKDGSWGIKPIGGVYFYENSQTSNWAVFDKKGDGILYLDGRKEKIDSSNFHIRPDAKAEFFKNGHWQIVEMYPAENLNPAVKYERSLTANLVEPSNNNEDKNVQVAQNIQNQDILNQPLAVNSSSQEVYSYAFAALLSDDPGVMHVGLEKVFSTNVAQQNMQQANQAVIAFDSQQAIAQQMNSPVMTLTR